MQWHNRWMVLLSFFLLAAVAMKCVGVSLFLVLYITVGGSSSVIEVSWKSFHYKYLVISLYFRKWRILCTKFLYRTRMTVVIVDIVAFIIQNGEPGMEVCNDQLKCNI
jgi:hypothetical protein